MSAVFVNHAAFNDMLQKLPDPLPNVRDEVLLTAAVDVSVSGVPAVPFR